MSKLMIILFAAVIAIAYATEDCFDKAKLIADWKDARDECKVAIPAETPEFMKKVAACMMKKHGLLSEDGVLDYVKTRHEYENIKARDIEDELKQMDQCWETTNHVATEFFDCWTPKLHELCPDSVKWIEIP